MAERLFGLETEYALTALRPDGAALDRLAVLRRLMALARNRLAHLPDGTGRGFFLANGGRFYIDMPDHPEFSTPEVTDPWDAVRYVRAGDRLLETLVDELLARDGEAAEVIVLRCNVDYSGNRATWASHESYLHRSAPADLPQQLIPHLVSRLLYTGAGGFDATFPGGLQFTLSPRTWHLEHAVSAQSTHSRGIFHDKDEPLAKAGYHRLHVLCGESLCSDTASWLRVATTALVVALIDGGVRPGDAVQLCDPLAAMRCFALDPTCEAAAPSQRGGPLKALDIQRHYLEAAENNVRARFMPPWAEEACHRWREMLGRLAQGPEAVATTLDWAIKLALYRDRARRQGVRWESLPKWNRVARSFAAIPGTRAAPGEVLERRAQLSLPRLFRQHRLDWDGWQAFRALRGHLFETDTRFGQLGARGIFAAMERAGALAQRMPGVDDIERAVEHPPAAGRARLRGELVRALAAESLRYVCDWTAVRDVEGRRSLDLCDPFATTAEWAPWPAARGEILEARERLHASWAL